MLSINANCDTLLTTDALNIIKEIFNYIRIIAPILLILLIAFDYASAVINNDDKALTEANSRVVGRLIGAILLFLVPTIVKLVLDTSGFDKYSNDYMCDNATGTAEKYVIYTTEKKTKKTVTSDTTIKTTSETTTNVNTKDNPDGTGSSQRTNQKIGDKTNPKDSVCLKNQSGLRDKYQKELEAKIAAAGSESRAAVVASAIYMSSEIGIKIPYFPGGCHSKSCLTKGIPESIGCQKKVVHNAYKWPATLPGGFDCSGFTFWVYGSVFGQKAYISSEMHNREAKSSKVVDLNGKEVSVKLERVAIEKSNYEYIKTLLQPGDLVGSDGHIGMVIDTSRLATEGIYTVAHATSRTMQLSVETFTLGKGNWNRFVLMRKFFLEYDCLRKNNQDACQKYNCINDKNCNSNNIRY